jgi:serine/threonine protein kinase
MSSIQFTSSSKRTQGGTLRYQAPELHQGGHNDQRSDIYGFASLAYEVCSLAIQCWPHDRLHYSGQLLAGTAPFPELCADGAVIMAVLNGRRPSRPPSCSGTPVLDGLWKLLQRCWAKTPGIRPTASQIVEHLTGADIQAKKSQSTTDWDDAFTSRFRRHFLGPRPLSSGLEFERVIFDSG